LKLTWPLEAWTWWITNAPVQISGTEARFIYRLLPPDNCGAIACYTSRATAALTAQDLLSARELHLFCSVAADVGEDTK